MPTIWNDSKCIIIIITNYMTIKTIIFKINCMSICVQLQWQQKHEGKYEKYGHSMSNDKRRKIII